MDVIAEANDRYSALSHVAEHVDAPANTYTFTLRKKAAARNAAVLLPRLALLDVPTYAGSVRAGDLLGGAAAEAPVEAGETQASCGGAWGEGAPNVDVLFNGELVVPGSHSRRQRACPVEPVYDIALS